MSVLRATICFNANAKQANKRNLAKLKQAFKDNNINYNNVNPLHLHRTPAKKLGRLLVAVGGDGTINLVANAALKYGRKVAVVPQGTFNHFAKDLGLPLDIVEAAQTAASGKPRSVDVGQVNDLIFLNNSVLGFYPHLVAKREALQGKFGKWLALVVAAGLMIPKIRRYRLQMLINGKTLSLKTSLLVIANNKYDISGLGLASRKKLDGGKLYVYIVKSKTLLGMLGVSLRLLAGTAREADFDCYCTDRLEVTTKKNTFRIALDGETVRLKTPLLYKISPKALTVIS